MEGSIHKNVKNTRKPLMNALFLMLNFNHRKERMIASLVEVVKGEIEFQIIRNKMNWLKIFYFFVFRLQTQIEKAINRRIVSDAIFDFTQKDNWIRNAQEFSRSMSCRLTNKRTSTKV